MTTHDALLRAILCAPEEDTPRLVYADYLEENGEGERAEFIRVQCGLYGPPLWTRQQIGIRARQLLQNSLGLWCRWKESPIFVDFLDRTNFDDYEYATGRNALVPALYTRGFVSAVKMPTAAFLQHARAIFRAHPVTSVTLTGRQPLDNGETVWEAWWRDYTPTESMWPTFPYYLPPALFDLLTNGEKISTGTPGSSFRRYSPYQQPSRADVAQACIAYGRSREHGADLPPLLTPERAT